MIFPEFLHTGDKVAIVSPASAVRPEYIDGACRMLESWGYMPVAGKHCKGKHGYYSGTLEERLCDFKTALHNPEIKAILCGRGGYGTVHLTEYISTEELRDNAKWIIGFSDISVLHAMCNHAGIASIHASMAKHLTLFDGNDKCNIALQGILAGNLPTYSTMPHEFDRTGTATGEITGGNLAVLGGLVGTKYGIFKPGKILFIEDIGEPIYKVERLLYNLRLSGILPQLKGLIVGQFTDFTEPNSNGETMYGMIREMVAPYDYPVAFNFPIGHIDNNHPIIEGATATLNITENKTSLSFLLKQNCNNTFKHLSTPLVIKS